MGLESLKYYLLGRDFVLETEHRALQKMQDENLRISGSLQQYNFTV